MKHSVIITLALAGLSCTKADALRNTDGRLRESNQACVRVFQDHKEHVTECQFGNNTCYAYFTATGSNIVCGFGERPAQDLEL